MPFAPRVSAAGVFAYFSDKTYSAMLSAFPFSTSLFTQPQLEHIHTRASALTESTTFSTPGRGAVMSSTV